jgi:hypothetical protein|tara:strand:- start:17886 stop:19001 length:1116 start_codon:yes stop_codon:yes gene_type:complete
MATWKKVVLAGSAAELTSLSLTTALAFNFGGTGQSSYTTGDILYANGTAGQAATSLDKLAIGSNGQVLKIASGKPSWGADSQGSVSSVTSATTSQLTTSTLNQVVTLTTLLDGLDSSGGGATPTAALATGAQISTYVNSRGFTTNTGTITQVVGSGTVSGLTLSGTTSTGAASISLTGTITGLVPSSAFAANQDRITVGTTNIDLGQSSTTIAGLTGIDYAAGNGALGASIGSGNTLTIGNSTSTVNIPGNFRVAGTASFTDAQSLEISDKVIILASGSTSATAGGFIVDQGGNSGEAFGFDNATSGGRWGFKSGQADNADLVIDLFVPTVQVASSAPSSAPSYGGVNGTGQIAIDTNGDSGRGEMYIYFA